MTSYLYLLLNWNSPKLAHEVKVLKHMHNEEAQQKYFALALLTFSRCQKIFLTCRSTVLKTIGEKAGTRKHPIS